LPALHPGAHERRLFVLACADQAGARAIMERIEKELRASKDLEAAGVELKISFATVDIPSLKGDAPVEALAEEAAKRVELAVGRAL
jgi:hypothetical protein